MTSGLVHVVDLMHAPPLQMGPVATVHVSHTVPPTPHALALVPSSHFVPSQHPVQERVSHTQAPREQRWPSPHLPVMQTPSHPSLAPQSLPAHVGTQGPLPQTFGVPPPPHVRPPVQTPQWTT